ncbi:MAG: tetratricopeptide repeat protein [Deltaproteobacteria bacterium]
MDAADNPKTLKDLLMQKWERVFLCSLGLLLLLSLCGCHLPKISVIEDPLTPQEHMNLGVAYERSGELDSAIKEYQKASGKLPDAYLYLGNVYFLKNELKQAEAFYKKAIEHNENNADAYNNLAWLYYVKRENLNQAEHLAIRAIELNPEREGVYRDTLDKIRQARSF